MSKILNIIIFFSLISCNGDNKKNGVKKENITGKNEMNLEKFDIEKFNKHQQNNEWVYIDKDGNFIRELKNEYTVFENNEYTTKTKIEGYAVEIKQKNNLFLVKKKLSS